MSDTSVQSNNRCCSNKQNYIPIGLFAFSFITTSLASGIVYGWPSLRLQILSEEGSSLDERTLGAIFTAGSWATQASGFIFGIARDRWLGTRITALVAIVLTAMGIIGIAFSSSTRSGGGGASWIVSLFLVGMGAGIQACLQPVACLFRLDVQGVVMSVLSGGFQVSGLVFLVLTSVSDGRRIPFTGFGITLMVLGCIAVVVLPRGHFNRTEYSEVDSNSDGGGAENNKAEEENDEDGSHNTLQNNPEAGAAGNEGAAAPTEELQQPNNDDETVVQTPSITHQLKSTEYICLILWLSILLIPLQVYVATIGYQLEQKGDEHGTFTRLFSVLYASSAVTSPLLGKICDTAGLGVAQALATILLAASFFLLSFDSIPLSVHTIGMMAYCLGRMMVFATFFTNIGKRFGYGNYGTLSGLGLLLSAIISLLQYPLINAVTDGNDLTVNIVCGISVASTLPYCIWLGLRERQENII